MERNNSENSSGLEWQNLGSHCTGSLYLNDPRVSSLSKNSKVGFAKVCSKDAMDDSGEVGFVCSVEPMTGLWLGLQKGFSPDSTKVSEFSDPLSSTALKRSRLSPSAQNSSCQVEGCNLDLTSSKDYHRRHRICENHSKSPKVIVAGMERRFCQQCSRFHNLSEFDDKKRSCRRRLYDHNARRRRLQPDSSSPLSSSLSYDRRAQDASSNRFPVSVTNSSRESICSSMFKLARDSAFRAANTSEIDLMSPNFSSDKIPHSIYTLQMDSERFSSFQSFSRVLGQCLHVPYVTNSSTAPQHESAQSLLSSNAWSLNDTESMPMDGFVHGINYNPIWTNFQPAEQISEVDSAILHNSGPSQFL